MLTKMVLLGSRVALFFGFSVLSLAACSQQRAPESPVIQGSDQEIVLAPSEERSESEGEFLERTEKSSIHSPLIDGREPDVEGSLPELTFRHLGMHIGGESNSAESKQPWLRDIEAGEEQLLMCYRYVKRPMKGGSYGVDLYVGRSGGAPEVRGSRQKIGDDQFEECMRRAFRSLQFHRPGKPTVLSYSLLFSMGTRG